MQKVTWIHFSAESGSSSLAYKGKEDAGDADPLTYDDFISAFDNGLVIVDIQSESNQGCELLVSYSINESNPDGSVKLSLRGGGGRTWNPLMSGKGT